MKKLFILLGCYLIMGNYGYGQSPSFQTYMNPVIPGDHPDATLTRVGDDFYTTGSSFNVTPVIFHSTDLVHWEAIAQPVKASWSGYGDSPGGGCWGGHMVYYNGQYWDFFCRNWTMYFVTASDPKGPWSDPVHVNDPPQLPYTLGYDNSIFIDDDGKWYLVVKNGQPNNGIVELGTNGQPAGEVYNLDWLNPEADSFPYSWAEGPVMWKYGGYYYYSFARDLEGGQLVMRSDTLTADSASWEMLGDFFNESDPGKPGALFTNPNHVSPVVMLDDSTHWIIHPLYAKGEWKGQGRQGLLNQVSYDSTLKPVADYPINSYFTAPELPSSGIPWMVPKSDFFDSTDLNPEWSFLGRTPDARHSLTDRPGWLRLSPKNTRATTVIKNDGEHNYSLITRLDFDPQSIDDEAGLRIMRGDETKFVKLYSSVDEGSNKVIAFSFDGTKYETDNTVGDTLWLRMIRTHHIIKGYFSSNGSDWVQVGGRFDVSVIDSFFDYVTFTGTRQGLYVDGDSAAFFDLYIYRDAYTFILAEWPANQFGTWRTSVLDSIHNNDWALYAGVEFGGNTDYPKAPDSFAVVASSAASGGVIEVWLDSLDTGTKIAECNIGNTGDWENFEVFTSSIDSVSGRHDVYLKFIGGGGILFRLESLKFLIEGDSLSSIKELPSSQIPNNYVLEQNYPNPFSLSTTIRFGIPNNSFVSLKVYNILGQEVAVLAEKEYSAGVHSVTFDASHLASGMYFYKIKAKDTDVKVTKKMILIR
jgi:xylan 1,4-beta-xylosidase